MALTINQLFDEQFYLETNPGVAEAVANGTISDGLFHFIRFGQFEQRDPSAIFNTNFYLAANPGVATVVEQNILTPTEHFINFGQFEPRDPSALLNTSFYLDRYPGVAEAVATTPLTTTEHFLNFGQFEGRLPRLLFSDIYVFGDSLSDTGNAFAATGGLLPPSPPYFQGRTSNGPLWVETLAPQLAVTSDPNLNFAVNGATTGIINTTNNLLPEGAPPLLIGLQTQIDNFIAETPATDPNALYVVFAGSNDYLGGENLDVQSSVGNLSVAVNKLASIGARNFVLPNLPDLGVTPLAQSLPPEQQQGLTLLTEGHNSALAAASPILEQDPNINIINLDTQTVLDNIITNPGDFGFTNVTDSFLASGPNNPDDFLFFDLIHPTTNAHNLVADEGIKSITEINELLSIVETSPGF
ncbi:MAG: SGNH/GDSL hydrolase family protein [Cyanobacteria bacterium P01_H01_bin.35]